MNRQIKFRVWTGVTMEYRVLAGALGHFYVEGTSKNDSACLSDANTIYNEATPLMQWPGLLDQNGAEIWEGDIVKADLDGILFEVKFGKLTDGKSNEGLNCFYLDGTMFGHGWRLSKWSNLTHNVIGNIHANPELLK